MDTKKGECMVGLERPKIDTADNVSGLSALPVETVSAGEAGIAYVYYLEQFQL